jgi:hypothetical protein
MSESLVAYKGFDKDWKCRGFQYEIGGTYEHDGEVVRCATGGFHSCEYPLDVFGYYGPSFSRYAVVQVGGAIDRDDIDTKIASGKITVEAEISVPDLVSRAIEWITARCDPKKTSHVKVNRSASSATGYRSASSATGDQSASSATGYRSASSATGDRSASSATGDQSASSATGDQSASSATGKAAVALNTGRGGRAKAGLGGAIVLCNHDRAGNLRHIRASKVGENGIRPDVFYTLNADGEFEEATS